MMPERPNLLYFVYLPPGSGIACKRSLLKQKQRVCACEPVCARLFTWYAPLSTAFCKFVSIFHDDDDETSIIKGEFNNFFEKV